MRQARHLLCLLVIGGGRHGFRYFQAFTEAEILDHVFQIRGVQALVEHLANRLPCQFRHNVPLLAFFNGLQFNLAIGRRQQGRQITNAWNRLILAQQQRAAQGITDQAFVVGYGHAHAHARTLVDVAMLARHAGDFRNNFLHELRHRDPIAVAVQQGRTLGLHDVNLNADVPGVMGADLGAVAVLERGDDAAAVGVILGVGAGHNANVQRQPRPETADLHVALLHDVEEPDLQFLRQVRQFVDAENAPIGARHQAVVDHQFIGQIAAFGNLDGVDFADQLRRRHVGRGQFFAVAVLAIQPGNWRVIAFFVEPFDRVAGDGVQGVVVNFAPFHVRHPRIEQCGQAADEAGLRLAALAKENHVLAGEQGILHLRDNGFFEPMNAGKKRFPVQHLADEVLPHLRLDAQRLVTGFLELAQRFYVGHIRS